MQQGRWHAKKNAEATICGVCEWDPRALTPRLHRLVFSMSATEDRMEQVGF